MQLDCELIMIKHVRYGQMYIDDTYISFVSKNQGRPGGAFHQYGVNPKLYYKGAKPKYLIWMVNDITEIHVRRINMFYSGLELFTKKGETFLVHLFSEAKLR